MQRVAILALLALRRSRTQRCRRLRPGVKAKNIAKVAAARKSLTLVYYSLRDGEIRCLTERAP